MAIVVSAKQEIRIGGSECVQGNAPEGCYSAVFEDDVETGYFYALDHSVEGQPIQDAVHIYNVANVSDKNLPSEIKIAWSVDNTKTVLLINNYPHAVFDSSAKRGFCRTGFPAPDPRSGWSGHEWSEESLDLFA